MYILHNEALGYLLASTTIDNPQGMVDFVNAAKRGLWATDDYPAALAMIEQVAKRTNASTEIRSVKFVYCDNWRI